MLHQYVLFSHLCSRPGKSSDEVVLELVADILQSIPQTVEGDAEPTPGQPARLKLQEILKLSSNSSKPSKSPPRSMRADTQQMMPKDTKLSRCSSMLLVSYRGSFPIRVKLPLLLCSSKAASSHSGVMEPSALEEINTICNSAMFTVLRQEVDRFNALLHIIHKSLQSLILAVKGEVVMSEPLEEAYNALLSQRVPAEWKVVLFSCHLSILYS